MPNPIKQDIENKIATMIIADTTNFSTLKVCLCGFQFKLPLGYYPCAEVMIVRESPTQELTGRYVRDFVGVIMFSVLQRDIPQTSIPVSKIITVQSSLVIAGYVDAAIKLLKGNPRLQNLTGSNWSVVNTNVDTDAEYGFASRDDKDNNYTDFGVFNFVVTVNQAR